MQTGTGVKFYRILCANGRCQGNSTNYLLLTKSDSYFIQFETIIIKSIEKYIKKSIYFIGFNKTTLLLGM